eukprot:TRINITY_DN818_c0_g1_i2.p1 TRINITY_DN818_c0_g1~~TRINITY_DN818_c0_g1_i2.p1  ORF type:complete len:229 (+),score=10.36 TRINITY_DN818_c0_g1_i2:63-749(+)
MNAAGRACARVDAHGSSGCVFGKRRCRRGCHTVIRSSVLEVVRRSARLLPSAACLWLSARGSVVVVRVPPQDDQIRRICLDPAHTPPAAHQLVPAAVMCVRAGATARVSLWTTGSVGDRSLRRVSACLLLFLSCDAESYAARADWPASVDRTLSETREGAPWRACGGDLGPTSFAASQPVDRTPRHKHVCVGRWCFTVLRMPTSLLDTDGLHIDPRISVSDETHHEMR